MGVLFVLRIIYAAIYGKNSDPDYIGENPFEG